LQVAKYLKANPDLLNKYLSEEEWRTIEPREMPQEFWDHVWQGIQKKNRSKRIVLWIKRTAAAACIAGIIGIGYYQFNKSSKPNSIVATNNSIRANIEHKITANNNSAIDLSPNSVLRYDVPFSNHKREIFLEGEAYFKVAKDSSKPFTVFAGGLATTALGTAFKICTNSGSQHFVTVKLFEGKVVIKQTDSTLK
jgi:transmembrane sensor